MLLSNTSTKRLIGRQLDNKVNKLHCSQRVKNESLCIQRIRTILKCAFMCKCLRHLTENVNTFFTVPKSECPVKHKMNGMDTIQYKITA